MNERTLRLLEFDAIRGRVADLCLSEEAADRLRQEVPYTDSERVGELKSLVADLASRMLRHPDEPRQTLPAIAPILSKLAVEGLSLDLEEAYALGLFLQRAAALKTWISVDDDDSAPSAEGGPSGVTIASLAKGLVDCSSVEREIFKIIDKSGNLRDLPEVREIKRRIQNLHKDLDTLVHGYTLSEESRRFLQSEVPSQRDGRIVLAVKANFRNRIRGIVHEVSDTGRTVFIEPEDVVEKNNDILLEQRHLEAEIARIFRELTGRIAKNREDLQSLHGGILYLESLRARSRYGFQNRFVFAADGTGPSPSLVILQGRHPLLGSKAVPIDVVSRGETRMVIITGPNTGGKTVTLKTVGLFALMNQFGLALPAKEGTILPVFDGIYADIGDEQSISQSLSTFSAHMVHITDIISQATDRSLVLLDELGSGTDPEEGTAIAMAVLDHFIEKGTRLFCTTHHGVLKNYGYSKRGVENASVEFDGATLSPTYKIVMGIPGESRALDVAERNGLPSSIVQRARGYIAEERSDVSALIRGLKEKHRELEEAKKNYTSEDLRLREERRRTDLKELQLKQKELELRSGSVAGLHRLLSESRKTLENLVRELKEGEINREKTLAVKEFLAELEKTVQEQDRLLEREEADFYKEKERREEPPVDRLLPSEILAPGVEVMVKTMKRRGVLLRKDKKDTWVVEVGSVKMSFPEKDLSPVAPVRQKTGPLVAQVDLVSQTSAQLELNLRGLRLEEALEVLRKQIDAATLSGLYEFSVIHGKGDGILQKGVHEFLKNQSQVERFSFSPPEQGGFGKTLVSLKR